MRHYRTFLSGSQALAIASKGPDRLAATAAAVAGLGIVSTGLWNCRPELASGALVQVLADWQMSPIELHALFAAGRVATPSVRAFADYLAGALSE